MRGSAGGDEADQVAILSFRHARRATRLPGPVAWALALGHFADARSVEMPESCAWCAASLWPAYPWRSTIAGGPAVGETRVVAATARSLPQRPRESLLESPLLSAARERDPFIDDRQSGLYERAVRRVVNARLDENDAFRIQRVHAGAGQGRAGSAACRPSARVADRRGTPPQSRSRLKSSALFARVGSTPSIIFAT